MTLYVFDFPKTLIFIINVVISKRSSFIVFVLHMSICLRLFFIHAVRQNKNNIESCFIKMLNLSKKIKPYVSFGNHLYIHFILLQQNTISLSLHIYPYKTCFKQIWPTEHRNMRTFIGLMILQQKRINKPNTGFSWLFLFL